MKNQNEKSVDASRDQQAQSGALGVATGSVAGDAPQQPKALMCRLAELMAEWRQTRDNMKARGEHDAAIAVECCMETLHEDVTTFIKEVRAYQQHCAKPQNDQGQTRTLLCLRPTSGMTRDHSANNFMPMKSKQTPANPGAAMVVGSGPSLGSLRVWWIPQVPMDDPFRVEVATVREAKLLLDTLAKYDIFQFENRIKPDYSNAGGLEVFEDGEWCEWYDEDGNSIDETESA